ncbi:MAG: hypothetical protein R2706_17235 [Acidimicrobiales bacterium]
MTSAHEEGGERVFGEHFEFQGTDGRLTGLRANEVEQVMIDGRPSFQPVPDSEFTLEADFVFLAMGFLGPEPGSLIDEFGLETDDRSNIAHGAVGNQRRGCLQLWRHGSRPKPDRLGDCRGSFSGSGRRHIPHG